MKIKCPKCQAQFRPPEPLRNQIRKFGSFYRISDRKKVQRFYCNPCKGSFSVATWSHSYRQKKRQINHKVFRQLVAGTSKRECARLMKINRKTVIRKFIFMSGRAAIKNEKLNKNRSKINILEFDDLETFENSKYKPLSITLAVEHKTRWILGFEISRMPPKGLAAKRALKKYGLRADERSEARQRLFGRIQKYVHGCAIIKSDQNPHYVADVARFFPKSLHLKFKGRRAHNVGQGELKEGGFDPIFSLNHTLAVARYRLSRLIRKTWSTTKKAERLRMHLELLMLHHNRTLIQEGFATG